MEDSQISVLPPELAAEAQNLRRDWETRNRQIMQEQISQNGTSPSFSSVLRYRSRLPDPIFATHNLQRMRWSNWNSSTQNPAEAGPSLMTTMERQGQPLLDHESLASLLILLFIDEPKFNTLRLHRVIRNLCYHVPTRDWIIRALLSIIEKSDENSENNSSSNMSSQASRPQWLNIRLDAALGTRNNVFNITRKQDISNSRTGSEYDTRNYTISIHSQASLIICRHALDLLISLAKSFPVNFLPVKKTTPSKVVHSESQQGTSASFYNDALPSNSKTTDFWDILIRLETTAQQRKTNAGTFSKVVNRQKELPVPDATTFDESPFGQLIYMLSYNIVRKSSQLTDKLLRLLSFISNGLPPVKDPSTCPTEIPVTTATTQESKSFGVSVTVDDATETSLSYDSTLPQTTHLRLAIEVLTSKSCSEEGLEDATSLLLNLSQCSNMTRSMIISLLIDGATFLAATVQLQISELMADLKSLNRSNKTPNTAAQSSSAVIDSNTTDSILPNTKDQPASTSAAISRDFLLDRFTKETVVITSTSKQKSTSELQLPSMVPLISKTSSQSFFLRILKVIIQIREAVRLALTKEGIQVTASPGHNNGATNTTSSTTPSTANIASTSNSEAFASSSVSSHYTQWITSKLTTPVKRTVTYNPGELDPLSTTVNINELWDTLSGCLVELEDTADHHAVLVLQPAVEAFFLVHASSQLKSSTEEVNTTPSSAIPNPGIRTQTNNSNDSEELTATTESERNASYSTTSNDQPTSINIAAVQIPSASNESAPLSTHDDVRNNSTRDVAPVSPISLFDSPSSVIYIDTDSTEYNSQLLPNMQQNKQDWQDDDSRLTSMPENGDSIQSSQIDGISEVLSNVTDNSPGTSTNVETSISAEFTTAGTTANLGGIPTTLVDSTASESVSGQSAPINCQIAGDRKKFLQFAEKHRTVLNQILRQSTTHLSDGPFAVLVDHTRVLDFDVKLRYFRTELERMDEGIRREELAIHVHRVTVFEDSFREMYRRNTEEWKNRFYIVFEGIL